MYHTVENPPIVAQVSARILKLVVELKKAKRTREMTSMRMLARYVKILRPFTISSRLR